MAQLYNIPNFLTSLNLVCGVLAIGFAMNGYLIEGAYLVFLAGIFDFLDGFAARLLKISSEIGKQLDSLADVVTFGVAPGFFVYVLFQDFYGAESYIVYLPLLIPVFSALRLAKFNVDDRQSERFIGLPTPAHALFWVSLPFYMNWVGADSVLFNQMNHYYAFPVLLVVFSFLLVSELPLMSLKFKSMKLRENAFRFVLIGMAIVIFAFIQFAGIPIIILLYLIISIIENFTLKEKS